MKRLFTITALLISGSSFAQLYYGASTGAGLVTAWNGVNKEYKFGINDYYISVVEGYAFVNKKKNAGLLIEAQLQGTLSGSITTSALIGVKVDLTEHCGIHLLGGIADDLLPSFKPFQLIEKFHGAYAARLWVRQTMFQAVYIDHAYYVGIGVIGF